MSMNTIGRSRQDRIFDTLNFAFVAVVTFVILYPLLFVLSASVSDPNMVNGGKVWLWPREVTFEAYKYVLQESKVWRAYVNTVLYVAVDIGVSLAVILPLAYSLSRPNRMKGAGIITFLVAFTMLFSGGIIPNYLVVKQMGWINTVWSLTVPVAVSPYLVIITRTFFSTSLPRDLYDAAEIDGASFAQTFFRLVVPLSTAIIAVVTLFKGVAQWNNFFRPLIFLTEEEKYPLQLVLRQILLENQTIAGGSSDAMDLMSEEALAEVFRRTQLAETMKYALIIVASAPVLMLYPFLQKHLMKGIMLGAVKG